MNSFNIVTKTIIREICINYLVSKSKKGYINFKIILCFLVTRLWTIKWQIFLHNIIFLKIGSDEVMVSYGRKY